MPPCSPPARGKQGLADHALVDQLLVRLQSIKPIEPVTLQEEDAMYRDWKLGVRLVCVDATPPPLAVMWFFRSWICSGQVYTLRQIIIPLPGGPNPGPGVYLEEIHNPIEPESGFEYGYLCYRFEKLEEGTLLPARAEPSKTALQRSRWPGKYHFGRKIAP
jgi:hypothetical protein